MFRYSPNLKLWMRMEDGYDMVSKTTFTSSSPAPVDVAGKIGRGRQFSDNNKYYEKTTNDLRINYNEALTVSFWFYLNHENPSAGAEQYNVCIGSKHSGYEGWSIEVQTTTGANPNALVDFFLDNHGASKGIRRYCGYNGSALEIQNMYQNWTHVCVTKSTSSDVSAVKCYINGVEVSSYTTGSNTLGTTATNTQNQRVRIGPDNYSYPYCKNHYMDEIMVWTNFEASLSDVKRLARMRPPLGR